MKTFFKMAITLLLIGAVSPILAGQGYFVTIKNASDYTVTTSVSDINCMEGVENLAMILPPVSTSPSIYIEKIRGLCIFDNFFDYTNKFTLHIQKANGETSDIKYKGRFHTDETSNPNVAHISNLFKSGDQYQVEIYVNR